MFYLMAHTTQIKAVHGINVKIFVKCQNVRYMNKYCALSTSSNFPFKDELVK